MAKDTDFKKEYDRLVAMGYQLDTLSDYWSGSEKLDFPLANILYKGVKIIELYTLNEVDNYLDHCYKHQCEIRNRKLKKI